MKTAFLIPLLIMTLVHVYVFFRIWTMLPLSAQFKVSAILLCALSFVAFFIFFFAEQSLPIPVLTLLDHVGTSWLVAMLYLFLFFFVADLLRFVGLPFARGLLTGNAYTSIGVVVGLVVLLAYGNVRYHSKVRVPLSLSLHHPLPRPIKAVAMSDIHLGYTITKDELARWVELVNAEKPDVVFIAGDLVDGYLRPLIADSTAEVLATLHAPLGVYACLGNHEYMAGDKRAEDFLRRSGITMLRDSVALVDDMFYVVGRDDRSNPRRSSLAELVKGLDRSKPLIVLDHQPYELELAAASDVDLQLSGHTHRGQVWPISLITDAIYERSHGYLQKDNTHIYVSSGIGIWGGKFRIGTQSEYVVIDMQ